MTALPDLTYENGWQPIETAPRDGRDLLLVKDGCVTVGRWWGQTDQDPYWATELGYLLNKTWDRGHGPTHWRPLPEPPAGS